MESRGYCLKFLFAVLCILVTNHFTQCEGRHLVHIWKYQGSNLHQKLKLSSSLASNGDFYTVNSPLDIPPFDSLSPPLPQPGSSPPLTPQSPSNPPPPASYGLPTPPPPSNIIRSPPENPPKTTPPQLGLSPPSIVPSPLQPSPLPSPPQLQPSPLPSPPQLQPSPLPSPPQLQPSPPNHVPTLPKQVPGQPISGPPVLNPPPRPPPQKGSKSGTWCVAKPAVPDSLIQAAMDYACGSGADCKSIQPNQACFEPNTMLSHASYAFNSYWQNTKGSGGTCDFGGTAMLVTVDPSFDKCQFSNN